MRQWVISNNWCFSVYTARWYCVCCPLQSLEYVSGYPWTYLEKTVEFTAEKWCRDDDRADYLRTNIPQAPHMLVRSARACSSWPHTYYVTVTRSHYGFTMLVPHIMKRTVMKTLNYAYRLWYAGHSIILDAVIWVWHHARPWWHIRLDAADGKVATNHDENVSRDWLEAHLTNFGNLGIWLAYVPSTVSRQFVSDNYIGCYFVVF